MRGSPAVPSDGQRTVVCSQPLPCRYCRLKKVMDPSPETRSISLQQK